MKDKFDYFPEWDYNLYASNRDYKWLKDDYMIVINMYYKIMDSIPRYESIYERRKVEFKKATRWQKNKKYTIALSALIDLRQVNDKLRRFKSQIRYLIERKESIERKWKTTKGK